MTSFSIGDNFVSRSNVAFHRVYGANQHSSNALLGLRQILPERSLLGEFHRMTKTFQRPEYPSPAPKKETSSPSVLSRQWAHVDVTDKFQLTSPKVDQRDRFDALARYPNLFSANPN